MEQRISYSYDKGQFIASVRNMGGRSIGVTIPTDMRRELGLRPGMRVVVKVRIAKEKEGPEEDF